MKRNLLILVCIVGICFLLFKYQEDGKVLSASDSIVQNVKKLKASGEISSEQENLMKLQLAIVDYIAVKHTPPESLDELVPKYFQAIPINPQTKQPFQYQKKGNDYKILDSLKSASTTSDKVSEPQEGSLPQKEQKKEEFLNPNNLKIETLFGDYGNHLADGLKYVKIN